MISPRSLLAACVAALLATTVLGQRPSSWATTQSPGVQPAQVQHRGKLLWFVNSGKLHVFSSATRRWHTRFVGASATIRTSNDWLLIQEGVAFTAFGAMSGTFETLVTTAGQVVNPSGQRNDGLVVVLDGNELHWFAGLIGDWETQAISPGALIAVQRDVAVVAETNGRLTGISALTGTPVTANATGSVQAIGADGSVGFVDDGTDLFAFAAAREVWDITPSLGPSAAVAFQRDVAVWHSPVEVIGFSGIRGEFSRVATSLPVRVTLTDHCALADSGAGLVWAFSAPRARWHLFTGAASATAVADGAVAIWTQTNPGAVHGYSALTDTIALHPLNNPVAAANMTVGAAVDSQAGELWLFSAMTGSWHQAPAGAVIALPQLTRVGALIIGNGNTHWAFSARSGRFIPLTIPGAPIVSLDPSSSVIAVSELDNTIHCFETRREVWLTHKVGGSSPLDVRIWRTSLVAFSDTEALGYGVQHGALETLTLPTPPIDKRASSEVAGAIFADAVAGFAAVADLTTTAQFPEFRRMLTPGSTVPLHLAGPAQSAVGAIAGFVSQPTPLPFGELLLDPRLTVTLTPLTTIPTSGHTMLPIPVIDAASLIGVELGFQAAILPPAGGQIYLTRLSTVRLN